MQNRIVKIILFVMLSFFISGALPANAQVLIRNIRHWSAPDHTRIVIDTSGEPQFDIDRTDRNLNLDFQDADLGKTVPKRLILNKTGIEKILITRRPGRLIRISLSLPGRVDAKVFRLKKFQDKPDRVVIDIEFPEVEKQESQSREAVKSGGKDKIIVIDPGHGGDDPGAIGGNGTKEKTVVLAISKKLRDSVNKKVGYRAFLTRKGDYYVSFKKRLTIAREYGADLFVSIHADAFRGRAARGSSVYCLSLRGASSEAGRLLASNENLSDVVGGVSDTESSDESGPIVLNMYQTNTINLSKTFGNQVLKHLEGLSHIKHAIVQEAPFRVLKLPDVPSLLIETAFISNPGEEQMLKNGQFQQRIASAVADAIYEYSPASPSGKPKKVIVNASSPRETAKAATGNRSKARFHKVRRGDTVHSIARKYDTTVTELAQLNRIKLDDPLYIGKKLKLPAPPPPPATEGEKAPPKMEGKSNKPVSLKENAIVYKVKRGDTLAGIARRHNTDVASLVKANQLKLDSPLYVGRKMKITPAELPSQGVQQNETEPTATITPKRFIYRVKLGDTFPTIAQRCSMSLDELLELNQIKPGDSLYVDQELMVLSKPADEEASIGKANGHSYH